MLPLRDTTPSESRPYVVYAIIALNALVFLKEISLGLMAGGRSPVLEQFIYSYGLVPIFYSKQVLANDPLSLGKLLPFFSSMFLHGGLMHILGNMWMLWIFGDNVEDWMGHAGFAVFYVGCGIAAAMTHMVMNLDSAIPVIGASGAIAGVMGAYFILYPRARVMTLVPIFFFIQFIELPAWVFLGFWFLLQFLSSASGAGSSVAWFAHIGGFIVGAGVVLIVGGAKVRQRLKRGDGPPRRPPTGGGSSRLSDKLDDYWK